MGARIDRERFDLIDYARFQQRLERCLSTLAGLLERPGFGRGPATLGAELELFNAAFLIGSSLWLAARDQG